MNVLGVYHISIYSAAGPKGTDITKLYNNKLIFWQELKNTKSAFFLEFI